MDYTTKCELVKSVLSGMVIHTLSLQNSGMDSDTIVNELQNKAVEQTKFIMEIMKEGNIY